MLQSDPWLVNTVFSYAAVFILLPLHWVSLNLFILTFICFQFLLCYCNFIYNYSLWFWKWWPGVQFPLGFNFFLESRDKNLTFFCFSVLFSVQHSVKWKFLKSKQNWEYIYFLFLLSSYVWTKYQAKYEFYTFLIHLYLNFNFYT